MTPVVNQAELRTAIASTPEAVKAALRAKFAEREWPSLDPAVTVWEAGALYGAASELADVARAAGGELRIPLDVTALRNRVAELPDDLAEFAANQARTDYNLPAMAHHSKWTFEHWAQAEEIIGHVDELAAARLRHVHAALALVPAEQVGDNPDDYRHTIVGCITNGRTSSARKLTGPEAAHLARWAEAVSLGQGGPPLTYEPDWKAESKKLGLTQADLKKASGEWHRQRHLPVPGKLSDITDHRAIAYLLATANDGRTVAAETAEVLAAAAPEIVAEVAADDTVSGLTAEEEAAKAAARIALDTPAPPVTPAVNLAPPVEEEAVPTLTLDDLNECARLVAVHHAARVGYETAATELIAFLDRIGAAGINVARPQPVAAP